MQPVFFSRFQFNVSFYTYLVRLSELFSVIYRSSGIEIKGISTRIIQRSIEKVKPTLQKEIFVPNEAAISLQESIRVNMQIVLENYGETTIKVFEIIDEESVDGLKTLSDIIIDALSSEPEVTPEITVFTNQTLEIPTVTVQTGSLPKGIGDVVVATNILSRPSVSMPYCKRPIFNFPHSFLKLLQQIYDATEMGGFIISTETNGGGAVKQPGLETITVHYTEAGMLILLRKSNSGPKPVIIEVTDKTSSFNWLSRLQKVIVCDKPSIVYAQNQPLSGILGLTKSLRKEPKGKNVVCVFIADKAPTFDKNLPFYKEQLQKGLAINVFKDGKWGTYRYLPLEKKPTVMRQHCQAVVGTKGDPSSIRWAEGMLTSDSEVEIGQALIHVRNLTFSSIVVELLWLLIPKISSHQYAPDNANFRFLLKPTKFLWICSFSVFMVIRRLCRTTLISYLSLAKEEENLHLAA